MLYPLISLTVVLLSQIVGIILCLALLILPVATASSFCRSLPVIMLLGTLICLGISLGGLLLSYQYDLPTGATIVEIAGGIWLLTVTVLLISRKVRTLIRPLPVTNRS